jgi:hypothetical protein
MLEETVVGVLCSLGAGYLLFAFWLIGALGVGLGVIFLVGLHKKRGSGFGLLLGFAVGVWASLCWIVVRYAGVYPNLPGAICGWLAYGVGTWEQELTVHVTNVIMWPVLGWLCFRKASRGMKACRPRAVGDR